MYCSTPSLPSETPHCHTRRLSLLTPLSHPQSLKRATALIQPSFAHHLRSQPCPLGISMYVRVTSFGQEIVKGGTIAWAGRVQRSNNDAPVGQSLPRAHTQQATPLSSHTRSNAISTFSTTVITSHVVSDIFLNHTLTPVSCIILYTCITLFACV